MSLSSSIRFAFSSSGGIAYHLIARRRAKTLWRPFRAVVRSWLAPWLEESTSLIVFGPSAGWTLPLDLFQRLSFVTFVEPDPIARVLLRNRLKRAGVSRYEILSRADLLPWFSENGDSFESFLNAQPDAAILFANVLGQIPLATSRLTKDRALAARVQFLKALRSRKWASYHDLFSGSGREARSVTSSPVSPADLGRLAESVFAFGDVVDHEMDWLPGSVQVGLWPLTESSLHVIGFTSSPDIEAL